jgi:hypothetical protein
MSGDLIYKRKNGIHRMGSELLSLPDLTLAEQISFIVKGGLLKRC